MSVFNPNGSYKETYRKELNRKIKHNFHGYVARDKSKEKYLIHKSYDEFVDFDEEFKDLKTINNKDNAMRGRPKTNKQPNQETVQAMKEAVTGETNKYETVDDIFDEAKKEIIVDNIQSEVEVSNKPIIKNTKHYKFKDLESLKNMSELVVVLSFFVKQLASKGFINLNSEEIRLLERDITNPTQAYILTLKMLLNRFTEKGILEFTDEEYSNILNKYKEFLIL